MTSSPSSRSRQSVQRCYTKNEAQATEQSSELAAHQSYYRIPASYYRSPCSNLGPESEYSYQGFSSFSQTFYFKLVYSGFLPYLLFIL